MTKPRPAVLSAPAAPHGAFDYDELDRLGLDPDQVIDFSVNSNPYGPPPSARAAIANIPLDRYPDRECLALRRAIVQAIPFTAIDQVVVGNGTAELLLLIALAFVEPNDVTLVIGPTFSEYARVAALMGSWVETYTATPETDFTVDLAAVEMFIRRIGPRLVFFCTPNNPTGLPLDAHRLFKLAEKYPDTLFISDEAYINFIVGSQTDVSLETYSLPNVIVLRSLTKDFALAGLRLGYALGQPAVIEALHRVRPAWNVNALAQAAGLAVLNDRVFLSRTIRRLHEHRDVLLGELHTLGYQTVPTQVHYFLVRVGAATAFRRALLAHNIMVRDCTSFGLPDYVRIATRTPDDNERLLAAFRAVHP